MKPKKEDNIKIFFKNGLQVEGKVHSWGKNIILSNIENNSFMVISSPKEIMMYKILKEQKENERPNISVYTSNHDEPRNVLPHQPNVKENIEHDEEINCVNTLNLELKTKKLADLHKIKIQEERKEFTDKLKSFHLNEVKPVSYTDQVSLPFLKK